MPLDIPVITAHQTYVQSSIVEYANTYWMLLIRKSDNVCVFKWTPFERVPEEGAEHVFLPYSSLKRNQHAKFTPGNYIITVGASTDNPTWEEGESVDTEITFSQEDVNRIEFESLSKGHLEIERKVSALNDQVQKLDEVTASQTQFEVLETRLSDMEVEVKSLRISHLIVDMFSANLDQIRQELWKKHTAYPFPIETVAVIPVITITTPPEVPAPQEEPVPTETAKEIQQSTEPQVQPEENSTNKYKLSATAIIAKVGGFTKETLKRVQTMATKKKQEETAVPSGTALKPDDPLKGLAANVIKDAATGSEAAGEGLTIPISETPAASELERVEVAADTEGAPSAAPAPAVTVHKPDIEVKGLHMSVRTDENAIVALNIGAKNPDGNDVFPFMDHPVGGNRFIEGHLRNLSPDESLLVPGEITFLVTAIDKAGNRSDVVEYKLNLTENYIRELKVTKTAAPAKEPAPTRTGFAKQAVTQAAPSTSGPKAAPKQEAATQAIAAVKPVVEQPRQPSRMDDVLARMAKLASQESVDRVGEDVVKVGQAVEVSAVLLSGKTDKVLAGVSEVKTEVKAGVAGVKSDTQALVAGQEELKAKMADLVSNTKPNPQSWPAPVPAPASVVKVQSDHDDYSWLKWAFGVTGLVFLALIMAAAVIFVAYAAFSSLPRVAAATIQTQVSPPAPPTVQPPVHVTQSIAEPAQTWWKKEVKEVSREPRAVLATVYDTVTESQQVVYQEMAPAIQAPTIGFVDTGYQTGYQPTYCGYGNNVMWGASFQFGGGGGGRSHERYSTRRDSIPYDRGRSGGWDRTGYTVPRWANNFSTTQYKPANHFNGGRNGRH